MASVNVKNCVKFYTTADEIGAQTLKEHCSSLISAHWVRFVHNKYNYFINMVYFKFIFSILYNNVKYILCCLFDLNTFASYDKY